jgi:hypothetical protein
MHQFCPQGVPTYERMFADHGQAFASEVHAVLRLVEEGVNDCEISRRTGIPRPTVRDWRVGKRAFDKPRAGAEGPCDIDHAQVLPRIEYAYLLGQYLGDGCLSRSGSSGSWLLRIFSDARYPEVIAECAAAMESIFQNRRANLMKRRDCACVATSMNSAHWPCLFPQHAPGKKHARAIKLASWPEEIWPSIQVLSSEA